MSSPWLTVFDHRFVDPSITNCRHVPGSIHVAPFAPTIKVEQTANGILSYFARVSSLPPRWFRYAPVRPLLNIVGIELDLRLRLSPFIHLGYSFVFAESDGWAFRMQDNGRIEIVCRGQSTGWNGLQHHAHMWLDVQWSWRINGQSLLRVNGDLVAIVPHVNVGFRDTMSSLWIGSNVIETADTTGGLPPTSSRPFYAADIKLIRVRLLTEERVKKFLDNYIPLTAVDKKRLAGCRDAVEGHLYAIMTVLRDVMSAVTSKETHEWVKEDGGNPISRSARVLHNHAQEVARAAIGYLNGNDEAISRFELHANKFFELFATLIDDDMTVASHIQNILNRDYRLPEECSKALKNIKTRYSKPLKKIETLVDLLAKIIEQTLRTTLHG